MYVAPPANFLLSHAIFHESETRDSEDSQRRRHRLISTQRRLFPSREFLSFPRLLLIVSLPHTKSRRILRSFNGAQASELTRYPGSTMNTYNRFAQPLYPISRRSSPPPPTANRPKFPNEIEDGSLHRDATVKTRIKDEFFEMRCAIPSSLS